MQLHDLAPKNKKTTRKRRGQGNASGNGTFGGRGCKGQNARAGGGVRLGFEGGQSGLLARMPKLRGFRNPNRVEAQPIQLSDLESQCKAGKVTLETLMEAGLISKNTSKVKVLSSGEVTKKFQLSGILASASAKAAIEKAGGSVE